MSENKLNDNDFGQILGKIVLKRIEQAEKGFKSTVELVKKNVTKFKDDQPYDFSKELELCNNYVEIYDAAVYLREYIFNHSKSWTPKNFKTYMHIRKSINFRTIYSHVWGGKSKGFVKKIESILEEDKDDLIYMFWSSKPVEYCYVGITRRGAKRLREWHLTARQSAEKAQKLTIIHLNETFLEKIESCIIRIFGIEEKKGKKFGIGTETETLTYNDSYGPLFESDLLKNYRKLHDKYKKLETSLDNFNNLKEEYREINDELDELRGELNDLKKQIKKI